MNTQNRLSMLMWISGLLVVSASWLVTAPQSQEVADTTGLTAPAQPVKKPAHDKPIAKCDWYNANVRFVFQQLSEYSGYDIVLDPKVSGTVSLTVTNKPWREIMGIVCKMMNLTVIKEPAYLYVVQAEDYRKQQLAEATMSQAEQAVEDLKREVVRVNNVKAEEMNRSILSLLSARGKITVVERNNALIIFDTEKNIDQIKRTIQELDVETDQISISCKIIEVTSGLTQGLGVRWGYFDKIPGINGANVSAQHLPVPAAGGGAAGDIVAGALEKLTYGILSQDRFAIALDYLFQNHKAEVVAQPLIITLDNKTAHIFMGSQVPVKYLDKAFNTVIQMVDAGTELTVTPHINGEKRISLDLQPKKRSYSLTGDLPIINEQSAQTNVVVSDGETVVIAGLTANTEENTEQGIPFLKDIPFIGNLFKRTTKTVEKNDLIVFVTPHIISKKVEAVSGIASPGLK
jgi:type IV pilus secretin PilQ/predicted competence protein